jgi:hypothetical protein
MAMLYVLVRNADDVMYDWAPQVLPQPNGGKSSVVSANACSCHLPPAARCPTRPCPALHRRPRRHPCLRAHCVSSGSVALTPAMHTNWFLQLARVPLVSPCLVHVITHLSAMPPRAGLPAFNATLSYCPGNLTSCYFFDEAFHTHSAAKAACSALGGGAGALVSYSSADEQWAVENYFLRVTRVLGVRYWWVVPHRIQLACCRCSWQGECQMCRWLGLRSCSLGISVIRNLIACNPQDGARAERASSSAICWRYLALA